MLNITNLKKIINRKTNRNTLLKAREIEQESSTLKKISFPANKVDMDKRFA